MLKAWNSVRSWPGRGARAAAELLRIVLRRPEPEDLRGITRASPWGALVTIANSLVYYLNALGQPYQATLGLWCICSIWIALVIFQRTMSVRDHLVERVSRRAVLRIVVFSLMMALPWLSLAVIVGSYGTDRDRILALVLSLGMAAGGIFMLHRVMLSAMIYCGTIVLLACMSVLITEGPGAWPVVFYALMFCSMLFVSAHVVGETARDRDRSILALSEATTEIQRMALEDGLTGLLNRAALMERLEEMTRASGTQADFALFMMDLDHFKNVNDSFGHAVGDELLRVVALRLKGALRGEAEVARLGGDEFAVLLPGVSPEGGGEPWAERILAAVNQPARVRRHMLHPGTSIGCSFFPAYGENGQDLLLSADIALNAAKARGRGGYVVFSPDLARQIDEEEQIAADLRIALAERQLRVCYQPKIRLSDGRILGAEALVRWRRAMKEDLSPDQFLEVAAERGLMPEVGAYIAEEIGRDILRWKARGVPFGVIAINIHAVDLKTPEALIGRMRDLLASGVQASDVILEITEGCFVGRGTDQASMLIDTLSEMGFDLSLDDFGTGHAALSHLKILPVQEVKIDRSFVLGQSRHDQAIVSAIVALGQGLGLRIVAEGIEEERQRAMMASLGVEVGQGFLWAPALAPADFEARVLKADGQTAAGPPWV